MSTAATTLPLPALDARTRTTFHYDCLRALGAGTLETAASTFIMLIAVRHFHASDFSKSLAGITDKIGLLLSPLIVTFVMIRQIRASAGAALLMLIGGLGFTAAALLPNLTAFIIGSLLGLTCASAAIPLTTQIYQDNYPEHLRGKLFSRQLIIRIASAVSFGLLIGNLVADPAAHFQWLMAIFAAASFLSAYALLRIPSAPLSDEDRDARNPFYALRFIRDDKTFRNTLISWMLVGIANLMMATLRVEYLGHTARFHVTLGGKPLTAFFIVLLTDIIPNTSRLCMSPVWGKFFDRVNFFAFRIAINLGFGLAIFAFFTGDSYVGYVIGAIIWGISNAGGDLCWTLWVTKLAPPHRVAHYMSVHTFLTGLRGISAPFLAFALIGQLSLFWLATIAGILIILSCLILIPEIYTHHPPTREVEEQTAD